MNEQSTPFPEALVQLIESGWFEDDGGIEWLSFTYANGGLTATFMLHTGDEDVRNEHWQLVVGGLKEEKIMRNFATDLSFHTDHFLLWAYTDVRTYLYFANPAENPDKLLVDLFLLHYRQYDPYFPIDRYFNRCLNLPALCCADLGLFATGPKKILTDYHRILTVHGMNPYFPVEYPASHTADDGPLGLLLAGESYFIGRDINFTRLPD